VNQLTQLISAKNGNVTEEMKTVALKENVTVEYLIENIAKGYIVIPKNKNRKNVTPTGIGKGLKTKVNANIGTSKDSNDVQLELDKARLAEKAGADAVMDLSVADDTMLELRKKILAQTKLPLGTVPMYQAIVECTLGGKPVKDLKADDLFRVIEAQAEEGVDFITVHCGVTLSTIERLKKQGRVANIVSRGGALLTQWMMLNEKENPLYENYDRILEIAKKHDVTLSLGDGLRPGSVVDATDRAQIHELILLGELQQTALEYGVQVMIEGPGHVPYNEIEANMILQKKLCNQAPFYVLGPLVTDIAMGYDHITSAIGGAAAAAYGADFLCYVTPSEHLRLPTLQDVEDGVIASRIAAHAGDIAKGYKGAIDKDRKMSELRTSRQWDEQIALSINPCRSREMRDSSQLKGEDKTVCSMCGEFCAIKTVEDCLKK
jgi:phosphomethylpyrimidine synthase